jgi:hypothetical protein
MANRSRSAATNLKGIFEKIPPHLPEYKRDVKNSYNRGKGCCFGVTAY